ncbi:FtsB family cell division protein [Caldalkalibacillus salinus]|uniref:FtsB family cell division protein n=1 Tax=Caldalkalibacillus salinus TaxID=2803787 RepID=UPI001924AACC|nr:septum formation initiator family protein [Caldalkalibacillus salinus]
MQPFQHPPLQHTQRAQQQVREGLAEEERQARKRKKRFKILGVGLVVFMIWAGTKWTAQTEEIVKRQEELEMVQAQVDQAEEEQMELVYQVRRLHDKDYIAEIARSQLFLSRPGEMIFVPGE